MPTLTPADFRELLTDAALAELAEAEVRDVIADAIIYPLTDAEIAFLVRGNRLYRTPDDRRMLDVLARRGLMAERHDEYVDANHPIWAWKLIKGRRPKGSDPLYYIPVYGLTARGRALLEQPMKWAL